MILSSFHSLVRLLSRVLCAVLIILVRVWQIGPSRILPPTCRYSPSCSAYAIEAIREHGALRGVWLTSKRLLRCHPWGGYGHDPVPPPIAPPAHSPVTPPATPLATLENKRIERPASRG